MRTIIAGSRTITDLERVSSHLNNLPWLPSQVVSGTARGVDQIGEEWAATHGIPCQQYPADWDTYGKSAGYRRNQLMAANADALVAVWDGKSRGTMHMIDIARNAGLRVRVIRTDFGPEEWCQAESDAEDITIHNY